MNRFQLDFEHALILDRSNYVSKNGNPWGRVRILDYDRLDVYDMVLFGESYEIGQQLVRQHIYRLVFEVAPNVRNGGVQTTLVSAEEAENFA